MPGGTSGSLYDLTGNKIETTYGRLVQAIPPSTGSNIPRTDTTFYDGYGNIINIINITASNAISASYAVSASVEILKEISSSYADTASYVNPLNQDVFINGDLTLTGSLTASGSNFTFIGPVFAEDATLSGSFSGSFQGNFSGTADLPDLTNNTGITPFIYNGSTIASIQVSGSDTLNQNTITKWSGDAFNNTNITDNGTVVDINSNTFITGSLTVSGSNSTINTQELQFDTDHIKSGHSTGRMFWDDDNKTVTLDMQGSDVRLQLGQEEHVYAKNTSGITINNGDAVRISGAVGTNVTIEKAIASVKSFKDPTEQDQILGLATEQIADNQSGYITTFGAVRDLNTSAFNEGDILYLSNTSSGSYLSIRPPAPFFEARIGIVQVSNATEGIILVRPSEPIFLTDISQITGSGVIVGGTSYLCYDDNTEIIEFTNSFTGSFSGSLTGSFSGIADLPDLTNSTGITAFTYDGSTTATIQVSGSDTLSSNTLPKWTGDALTNTNITDNGSVVAINSLTNITGSVDVLNGNVNLDANSYFFQGTSTGGSNVSLIGVNNQDQIYIGNQGFDNIIADDLAIQGNTTISGSLIVSGSITNDIQLFLPLTSSNDISSSADIYGRTGSFDYLNVEGDAVINGNTTLNGAISFKTYRLTSSAYTASVDDYRIGVKYTLTGSVEIQLPLITTAGEIEYKFKDEEGNAKKQNITIISSGSDLIDGDNNIILNRNYMAVGLYNDGTSNWFIE